MIVKLFEVRDSATFLPVIAIKCDPANEAERYLLARTGYGMIAEDQGEYVLMTALHGGDPLRYDAYAWGNNRTRAVTHAHIQKHFNELESGAVIDVQFLLGETKAPKVSEAVRC